MATYSEKLKDPRWQKKRLEILSRDNFTCLFCGETTKTLHVHHVAYHKGLAPWDYPNHYLKTLCCDCHENESSNHSEQEDDMIAAFRQANIPINELANLALIACYKPVETRNFIADHIKTIVQNG